MNISDVTRALIPFLAVVDMMRDMQIPPPISSAAAAIGHRVLSGATAAAPVNEDLMSGFRYPPKPTVYRLAQAVQTLSTALFYGSIDTRFVLEIRDKAALPQEIVGIIQSYRGRQEFFNCLLEIYERQANQDDIEGEDLKEWADQYEHDLKNYACVPRETAAVDLLGAMQIHAEKSIFHLIFPFGADWTAALEFTPFILSLTWNYVRKKCPQEDGILERKIVAVRMLLLQFVLEEQQGKGFRYTDLIALFRIYTDASIYKGEDNPMLWRGIPWPTGFGEQALKLKPLEEFAVSPDEWLELHFDPSKQKEAMALVRSAEGIEREKRAKLTENALATLQNRSGRPKLTTFVLYNILDNTTAANRDLSMPYTSSPFMRLVAQRVNSAKNTQ